MLNEISKEEWLDWKFYYELEPFGERLEDYRTAWVVKALFDIARDRKAHPTPFDFRDFLPPFGEYDDYKPAQPAQRQSWQEQKVWAQLFASAYNRRE